MVTVTGASQLARAFPSTQFVSCDREYFRASHENVISRVISTERFCQTIKHAGAVTSRHVDEAFPQA